MRIDTFLFTQHNAALSKEPRFVVVQSFDKDNTILAYLTSHADAALPGGGSVVTSVLAALSGTSQTLNPDQANATIGDITYEVVDKASVITTLLGTELALGRSTRQQRTQVYMGYNGDVWADYALIQTQLVTEIGYLEGKYTFRCQDIQRAMRNDVFVQEVTQLAAAVAANTLVLTCAAAAAVLTLDDTTNFPTSGVGTIRDSAANDHDAFAWTGKTPTTLTGCTGVLAHGAGALVCDATVNVVDTSKFTAVPHGTSYSDAPSATVGYVKIEDEVCRWVSKTATTLVLDRRGALNTVAAPHTVDLTQVVDQRTPVTEYVYLELPAVDLMYRLLTGKDRTGATALPTGWNLGIDLAYVRLADFTGIGKDLWDLTDDQQGFIVRFEDLQKTDGKKFIETELGLLLGVFMPIYANGALGCRRMANILAGAAYGETLDSSNVVSCGELVHDFNALHNVIQISWNWEPSQRSFTRVNIFFDQPSITVHKQAPTLKLAFRGLHGSRHSAAMLATRFDMIRDRYTGPPQRITTNVLHRFNKLEVGDVVRHNVRTVRDFVAGAPLDRSMEVQGISIDWVKGSLALQLFGSSRAPTPLPATGDATVLTHAFYVAQGTKVVNGTGGLTVSGTHPTHISGTGTLAGNADLTAAAATYYIDDDVVIDAGAVVTISQNVQFRHEGFLQVNGTILGAGQGLPGAAASLSGTAGTRGFLGITEPGGDLTQEGNPRGIDSNFRGLQVVGNPVVPEFNVTWNGTALGGLPTDLRGCSGSSGPPTLSWANSINGSTLIDRALGGAGGAGGAGLCLIGRGLNLGAAARVDLSGADGLRGGGVNVPSRNHDADDNQANAASGAGGAPGGLLVLIDGAGATVTGLTTAGFVANYGKTPVNGTPLTHGGRTDLNVGGGPSAFENFHVFYSCFVGTGDGTVGDGGAASLPLPSLSGGRGGSRVQFVPGNQAVQADPSVTTLTAPSSMGLAGGQAELLRATDGTIIVRVKVTWAPSVDARTAGYDLQFKRSADVVWSSAPSVLGISASTAWVAGLADGVTYDFRVRAAGATREVSDWVTITGFLVVGKTAKPADVGTITYAEPVISWPPNGSDDDLAGYIVRYQPSWASTDWASATPAHQQGFLTQTQYDTVALVGGQVTMLVKCVDTSGNESTSVSSKQIDLRPPVPTGFTVTRQPDGTRELAWILASPPSDLDGYRIKWFLGSTSDWTAMTLLHTGVLKASPFESNQLAAGTYTFAIKSVDKAGNESATALFITSLTIGDPRIAGSIEDFLEEPLWTETKTNAHVDGATGWLVANGSGTWATAPTWAAMDAWVITPSGSIQYERKIDVGLITTFTPLVTVVADSAGGAVTIEEAHSNVDSGYSAFAAVGPELLARWVKLRVTVTGTFPKLKSERIILSATPIEEIIENLDTSTLTGAYDLGAGNVRVPITKVYNVIKKVSVTLQSVGAGWTWELLDKDTSVGPHIKIYNNLGIATDAVIDVEVKGV